MNAALERIDSLSSLLYASGPYPHLSDFKSLTRDEVGRSEYVYESDTETQLIVQPIWL